MSFKGDRGRQSVFLWVFTFHPFTIRRILGNTDSDMGSCIIHYIFYLQDALTIITYSDYRLQDIDEIIISYTGNKTISFKEWLERE